MNLVTFNPRRTRTSINPFFDEFLNSGFGNLDTVSFKQPAVNISENDREFAIEIAAPGFNKKDFKIEVDNNQLKVSAEISEEKKDEKENYTKREFFKSSFERSFSLPETTKQEKIEAKYNDGVLSISIPKLKEEERPSRLINVG